MAERTVGSSGPPLPNKQPGTERRKVLGLLGGLFFEGIPAVGRTVGRGIVLSEAVDIILHQMPHLIPFIRQEIMANKLESFGFKTVPFSSDRGGQLSQRPQDNSKLIDLQDSYQITQIPAAENTLQFGLNLIEETTNEPREFVFPKEASLDSVLVCTFGNVPVTYALKRSDEGLVTLDVRHVTSFMQTTGSSSSAIFVSFDLAKFRTPSIIE